MPVTGSCLCEEISVTVDVQQLPQPVVCFCINCKKSGSTSFSIETVVPRDLVQIAGNPKIYSDTATASGIPMERLFCGTCSSPILSRTPLNPDNCFLKCGLFEHPLTPPRKIVCDARKESWVNVEVAPVEVPVEVAAHL
ncbi:hypothetical protein SISSUDRAFT_1030628 [Sistotremastrum suecicum HHB10207 ss-3]|uniref:CENP-V/GFA domain-containing protein n=1 Tax=Sistotremastrum suecicum HHB10207 ss-3 TaxID=1314776 RepID=A0A166H654_9AGAM|nr:hypothetical protein SISSUDRAFT_1030628 [Sistotremastrum suecicum HHB10207 ss-3]